MESDITAHLTIGAVIVYAIERLKSLAWVRWITPDTKILNAWLSATLAAAAAVGISVTFDPTGGVLTITGLTLQGTLTGIWEWLKQYAVQQLLYDGVIQKSGRTAPAGAGG